MAAHSVYWGTLQIFVLAVAMLTRSAEYFWRCSEYDSRSNIRYVPDFVEGTGLDISLNNVSFASSTQNQTYIFSNFTGLDCSGTVTAIKYCYSVQSATQPFIGNTWPVFALSLLRQNGSTFSVEEVIEVYTTPTVINGLCYQAGSISYCCDTMSLESALQFQIPALEQHAFGITVLSSPAALLEWSSSFQEYTVEQYVILAPMYLNAGTSFTVNDSSKVRGTLKLFRFHISLNPQYLWNCSEYDINNDRRYLPTFTEGTISDIARNNISFVSTDQNKTYIFSTPLGQGCGGTVTAIEFCFSGLRSNEEPFFIREEWAVFALSVLHKNESIFTVKKSMKINTRPTNMDCVRPHGDINYCCDTRLLEFAEQFQIQSSGFAFGITVPHSRASLLEWRSEYTEYIVQQYVSSLSLPRGNSFNLKDNERVNGTLKLVHFRIRQINSEYQWKCSDDSDGGKYLYVPNFSELNNSFIATNNFSFVNLAQNQTYIFSYFPGFDCSGVVTAIEYCYTGKASVEEPFIKRGNSWPVFTFSTFLSNGNTFAVRNVIDISTHPFDPDVCVRPYGGINYCCDFVALNSSEQFHVPVQNFAFGITILNSRAKLLGWDSSFSEYVVEHYITPSMSLTQGASFTLSDDDKYNQTLKLVRFQIEPDDTRVPVSSTDHASTLASTIQTTQIVTYNNAESFLETDTGIAVVAGSVGGLVLLLIIIIFISFVIVIVKFKQKRERLMRSYKYSEDMYSNALYMGENSLKMAFKDGNEGIKNPSYDYTTTRVHTGASCIEEVIADDDEVKYDYVKADSSPEPQYSHLNRKTEDIYMVPPSDISELYAHLEGYRRETITRDSLKLDKEIGSGQFGEVFEGVWKCANGEVSVAVKTLKEGCEHLERIKFLQEAAIMSQFKHDNVVAMHGVITNGDPVLLVLEMLERGDLRKYLLSMRSETGNEITLDLKAADLLGYCCQVSCGMTYLSGKAFVHRDLAARNILVSGDRICKIADFGMSRDLMDETYYISKGGVIPVKWTAPEALHYKKYSTASDVWSYGVVMYEIWSVGHKPFEGVSNNKVMKMIDSGYRLPPPPGCPHAIYSAMISCWNPHADQRPLFSCIYKQLSSPDSELLQISKNNVSTEGEETFKLGADLKYASNLFKDLQVKYTKTSNDQTSDCDNYDSDDYC